MVDITPIKAELQRKALLLDIDETRLAFYSTTILTILSFAYGTWRFNVGMGLLEAIAFNVFTFALLKLWDWYVKRERAKEVAA